MPGVLINVDGVDVEHWLSPGLYLVHEEQVDIVGVGLTTVLRPSAERDVTVRDEDGVTVLQARHPITRDPVTVRSSSSGWVGPYLVPRLDYTYDAGFGLQSVHSSDADELYQRAGELVAAADASASSAAAAAAFVDGLKPQLDEVTRRTADVPALVESATEQLEQVATVLEDVAALKLAVDELRNGGGGTSTGGGLSAHHVWGMVHNGSTWPYLTLSQAQAKGYVLGQPAIIIGLAEAPTWVPRDGSVLHATSANAVAPVVA